MKTNPGFIPLDAAIYPGSTGSPTPPIPITVTSHDFGGKAYLRAALSLAPGLDQISADVVDAKCG